jgi:hypothetical protein
MTFVVISVLFVLALESAPDARLAPDQLEGGAGQDIVGATGSPIQSQAYRPRVLAPTYTPYPTYTPKPTYTAYPVFTPKPESLGSLTTMPSRPLPPSFPSVEASTPSSEAAGLPGGAVEFGQHTIDPATLESAVLVANDGTYLGVISRNRYDSDSIADKYGDYGSKYSSTSIFNKYGTYGSRYSSQSAFSEYATEPPAILLDGNVVGYLTVNSHFPGAISTWVIVGYANS